MQLVSRWFRILSILAFLVLAVYVSVRYYSFLFSKDFAGQVDAVERVTEVTAILGARPLPGSELYSYSVSLLLPSGEHVTATSEDRQWAVVRKGQCVQAKFYPYPPWELDKAGTYFNARLLKLADCQSEVAKEMGLGGFAAPASAEEP